MQALRLNTLSKLTFADSKRFDSLVKDVFPGVPFRDVEYVELEAALREACVEQNLVVIDAQVRHLLVYNVPLQEQEISKRNSYSIVMALQH